MMGSISPPQSPTSSSKRSQGDNDDNEIIPNQQREDSAQQLQPKAGNNQSGIAEVAAPELRRLLQLREQEIRALKFELEKYKLALHQSQLDYHNAQRLLTSWRVNQQSTSDNNNIRTTSDVVVVAEDGHGEGDIGSLQPLSEMGTLLDPDDEDQLDRQQLQTMSRRRRTKSDHQEPAQTVVDTIGHSTRRLPASCKPTLAARLSSASLGSSCLTATPRVVFKAGADGFEVDDDDDNEEEEKGEEDDADVDVERLLSQSHEDDFGDEDDLEDIIHDVGEIDLNLELETDISGLKEMKKRQQEQQHSELRSSVGARGSQLAKSCPEGANDKNDNELISDKLNLDDDDNGTENNNDNNNGDDEDVISDGLLTSLTDAAISNLSQLAALQERCESQQQHSRPYQQQSQQQQQHPRPQKHSSPMASGQIMPPSCSATTALPSTPQPPTTTAAPANSAIAISSAPLGPILGAMNQQQQPNVANIAHDPFSATAIANQAAIAINAAASIQPSPAMLIHTQQPVSSSTSSLSPTSTVQGSDLNSSHSLASVVAAAAVAAAAANDHHHQQQHQQHQQQQQHHHHAQLNPQSRLISSAVPSPDFYHNFQQQHHAQQQQQNLHQHQVPSPVSSLHTFSPSTPSSSSLLAQSRRSACSNASSSLMSPIASPNYLRRQFMPDRLPLLSPSPTSGLTTGSSSAASTSLAHILNHHHQQQRSASALSGPITSTSSTPMGSTGSTAVSPLMSNKNSSQARLNNMQIRHKFGYLGSGRAQFNSPHGFCLGLNQEIVVADTNNHRVCIFDKSGSYITQFGSPGKEEGQLWNPRKVAILHRPTTSSSGTNNSSLSSQITSTTTTTAQNQLQHQLSQLQQHHHQQHLNQQASSPYSIHINNGSNLQGSGSSQLLSSTNSSNCGSNSEPLYVVCDRGAERSRMQLFTKDGAFIKKIGIHYIDIVAGLAITQNGLIIVVDSVSPTVYIINGETGILNGWFDCSGHMKEPSDIAVKSDVPGNEYFICDFKGHCVVVFSEQGEYLRKIGQDGLTSYPNGIDISDDGDILVGDSHGNRFHVVVFDRNGNFVSQFECPHVKVSRCCGLKITREGYIVTLAKNNHHVLVLDTIHI